MTGNMRASWIGVLGGTLLWLLMSPAAAYEGPPMNGLSSDAFRVNALTTNPEALGLLINHALDDPMLYSDEGGYVARQLADPNARAVLTEIVRCALGPSATVTHGDQVWQGELGLCQPDPVLDLGIDPPSWGPTGASLACQQLVTACVAARVNALDRSVPLALRGEPRALFPIHTVVPTGVTFRESILGSDPSQGIPIDSFGGPSCETGKDCNWAPAYVGRCDVPGGLVQLAIEDPRVCGATPVRVCAGIHGCYAPTSGYAPPDGYVQHNYGELWKEQTGACPSPGRALEFACPAGFGGSYSVMTRPMPVGTSSAASGAVSPTLVALSGAGVYPAMGPGVFRFREGAFYGNLFAPSALTWTCEMTSRFTRTCTLPATGRLEHCDIRKPSGGGRACDPGSGLPYPDVYACYSLTRGPDLGSELVDGGAYLADRICATPGGNCFAHVPERCHDPNPLHGAHCTWGIDGAYRACQGGGVEYLPITTYLNEPCDLIEDSALCGRLRGRVLGTSAPPFAEDRRPHGRRTTIALAVPPEPAVALGCATGRGTLGGLLPVVVAALLVRARRRTRGVVRGGPSRWCAPR